MVLAAGASMRMGSPKQLAVIGGERLLERAVRGACGAGVVPVIVVLGAGADLVQAHCELDDALIVINQGWAEGMGASIRAGMEALGDIDGCVVMTCDMPAVTSEHLRGLMASGELMASSYAGRRGVPAYFPAARFAELLQLAGEEGAREMLRDAKALELPGGGLDVDTQEDLARARLG